MSVHAHKHAVSYPMYVVYCILDSISMKKLISLLCAQKSSAV